MTPLSLHEFHQSLGATFCELNGEETVAHYGDWLAEHAALRATAGVLDFGFRSRLCLTGADRARFLHGQVTNNVKDLPTGAGCYAAVVNAKGKMESDLNIYNLPDELLLDFEPGFSQAIQQRLEKYLVADDVQIVDAAPHYGLLSVQGPKAADVVVALGLIGRDALPCVQADQQVGPTIVKIPDEMLGELYLANQPRLGTSGFDIFAPTASLGAVADKLIAGAKQTGGRACGWQAFETARLEAGIPRYGVDMDESNLPLECGIEAQAISYKKGCYIGQEVLNRIHSFGHVNRELRGLRLTSDLKTLPVKGDKLFKDDKEVGYLTSAVASPTFKANLALGYVRKESNEIGTELTLRTGAGESRATISRLPFSN